VRRPYAAGLALAACASLAACAHGGSSASAPAAVPSGGRVGYVRMDDLVRKHPLYGQLAQYEANIAALNLTALTPQALAAGPEVKRAQAQLDAQLDAAAKRTNALLQAKGKSYQDRENAAIAAALRAAAVPNGPGVAQIESQLAGTAQTQAAGAGAQAERDLDAYRKQLEAQDAAQIAAAQRVLAARAERTYNAKTDEVNAKEAALSLQLASTDAPERLSLRTKLSSLALDDAARDAANKELEALDRKEADALAVQRNLDSQELAALQVRLRAEIQSDMRVQVAAIEQRSQQRLRDRSGQLRAQFAAPGGPPLAAPAPGGIALSPNLPPALRARIAQLHADYTQAFQSDAKQTIAEFNRTRADLTQRYEQLTGADSAAAQSAQLEIASLERKHNDLYQQMVDQIDREVKTVAQERGVSVVVSTVAPAGGVDLTDDAMKDIETLHE
jgi:hypothetical protein